MNGSLHRFSLAVAMSMSVLSCRTRNRLDWRLLVEECIAKIAKIRNTCFKGWANILCFFCVCWTTHNKNTGIPTLRLNRPRSTNRPIRWKYLISTWFYFRLVYKICTIRFFSFLSYLLPKQKLICPYPYGYLCYFSFVKNVPVSYDDGIQIVR